MVCKLLKRKKQMSNLDILFVHSNASKEIYQDLSKDHSAIEPPIWAAMLANHCRTKNLSTAILDAEAEKFNIQQAVNEIINIKPKIACFVVYGQQPSASSQNMQGAIDTASLLKKIDGDIITLFVGGHVSALPRDVLKKHENCIDFICQNEGVYTISNFTNAVKSGNFDKSKIKGLGYINDDGVPTLNETEKIVSKKMLSSDLPGMAWDLLPDINKYRTAGWHSWSNNSDKSPFGALYTSLGCPFKCSFCMINIINRVDNRPDVVSSDSSVFRFWEPEFIIKQFDEMARLGIKNVKIADELFVMNPRHFLKICDLLIERDYGFNIWAYSRIDTCKPKYLEKLKAAGVKWLGLGIENPNTVLRKEVHKSGFKEIKINDVLNSMRDVGINIGANYIFGLPMDTKESIQETLDFAMNNVTEMVNFYSAMAYPGSPLNLHARKNNISLPKTYSGYSQHSYDTLNLSNKNLTSAEILKFRDHAWMQYHTNNEYLDLLETKFGKHARVNVENTTKIKLKRKLLGD
jgi:anaerobic magnesium-protoporphyrin IX monomethyl ester cyclase